MLGDDIRYKDVEMRAKAPLMGFLLAQVIKQNRKYSSSKTEWS